MKYHFCTLFNSAYLSRGLAMYESLAAHCPDFTLYIFPFDNLSFGGLTRLNLKNVVLVPYAAFEDDELREAKKTRPLVEFLWTCTPSVILYVLRHFPVEACTYLDADIYFFSDPRPIVEELHGKSTLITEHRFSRRYKKLITAGRYNVQFISARNDTDGCKTLSWWREKCLDSCENNPRLGKCGDQKYLDEWPERFRGVHIMDNLGGGLAPWNIEDYSVETHQPLRVCHRPTGVSTDLVFYHFHSFALCQGAFVKFANPHYFISHGFYQHVYLPYLQHLVAIHKRIFPNHPELSERIFTAENPYQQPVRSLKIRLRRILNSLTRNMNNIVAIPASE